jgi:AcrR family transcriptional regulator
MSVERTLNRVNAGRVTVVTDTHITRAQRRRNTEDRILAEARRIFADRGYERTTIRAVATEAGVDPALVMQYFGSKQELFEQAVELPEIPPFSGTLDALTEDLLTRIGTKIGPLPKATLAMLRSMLTHPEAAVRARATLDSQVTQIAAAVPGDAPELRAALMISTMLGVTIAHQLLDLTALRDAPAERIAEVLRPAFQALAARPD